MNVNINNFVINQVPDNIIKSNYSNRMHKGMFANMLKTEMTENQSMMVFLGNGINNILNTDSIDNFIEDNVEFEDNDETKNHISYENLNSLSDIFFFRPNILKNEVITDGKALNIDHAIHENQLLSKGIEYMNNSDHQKLFETDSIKGATLVEKPILEIEEDKDKPEIEFDLNEIPTGNMLSTKNKIITISDESTKIKSQVLSQVKDKIIIMTEKGEDLNGIKTITMKLQPQNLGKVDIKLIYENNKLTVEVKAFSEETQKILSSNTGELKDMLRKSSEADVNIIVKPYEFEQKHQPIHNYQNNKQGNEQNFYQNNDQNHQGRQRNKYYNYNNIKQNKEDVFSELVDLNNLKIKEGRYGS